MNRALLSLIFPGLAQLALGDRSGGLALASAAAGMLLFLALDPGWFTVFFIIIAYFSLVWHSVKDALHGTRNTESIQYVLGLAVVVGPFALPLLWQNKQIHRVGKAIWTVVILVLTALLVVSMLYLEPVVDQMLETYKINLSL